MPISDPYNIPFVLAAVKQINPRSIIDVGIGSGTYGFLLRQHLDVAAGHFESLVWKTKITGIEIYENYKNPVWEYCYDEVRVGDARQVIPTLDHHDLILMIDVIEHFSREDGLSLLKECMKKAEYVIITSPAKDYPQGTVLGNTYETHLSAWHECDFEAFPYSYKHLNDCFICILAETQAALSLVRLDRLPSLVAVKEPSFREGFGILRQRLIRLLGKKLSKSQLVL